MQFYRYFKGHEKAGRWRAIPVENEQAQFDNMRNGFYTILAVSENVKPHESVSANALYTGPFYIDIDSDDIAKSIKTAKKVLDRLSKNQIDPEEMNIWASGKRGFHITIPMPVFCDDTALPRLPFVYLHIAKGMKLFELDEVDKTVYSTGRGRMWRIENRERVDNQQYKVGLTADELANITADSYKKLCSAPRPSLPLRLTGVKNMAVQGFYSLALARAAEMRRPKSTLIDQNLKDALGDALAPPCVIDLADGNNLRDKAGFNQRSIQMNKALRAFVPDDEADTFIERFVHSNEGESHNTPESRREHLMRSRRTVQSGSDYEWSCRSILSILQEAPCDRCNICFIKDQQDDADQAEETVSLRDLAARLIEQDKNQEQENDADYAEPAVSSGGEGDGGSDDTPPSSSEAPNAPERPVPRLHVDGPPSELPDGMEGLVITDAGYGFVTGEGTVRRVSNFVLKFKKVYYEWIPNLEQERRVSSYAEVYVGRNKVGSVIIEDASWQSKSAFVGNFLGLSNCAFYGKDDDVQRMKSTLMNGIEEGTIKIKRVHQGGIHHAKVGEQDVFTYVEPGFSIDNFGHENLYSLSGQVQATPKLAMIEELTAAGEENTTILLKNLLKVNSPENVSRIFGWTMASFLKQHVFAYRNEFPLLSVWGQAGAGKTQTSGVFSSLHGVQYLGNDSPLSLGGEASSNFALWMFISSSMTAPRLIEEYNKKNLQKKYDLYSEYFKECWNQHSVKRGTIRNQKHHGSGIIDASTVDIPMTGPTIIISEQPIQVPALKHRTVEVQLYDNQRFSPEIRKAWSVVQPRWRGFQRFAKTAYMEALQIPVEQVREWIDSYADKLPFEIGERPHYSLCVVGMGLSFAEYLSNKFGLKIADDIAELRVELMRHAKLNAKEMAVEKKRTEVDIVIGEIARLVEISKDDKLTPWITSSHYMRKGDSLLLDGMIAHSQYVRYAVGSRLSIAIESYSQFKQLLRAEDYCDSTEYRDESFARGRAVLKLSIARMAARGLDVGVFHESM